MLPLCCPAPSGRVLSLFSCGNGASRGSGGGSGVAVVRRRRRAGQGGRRGARRDPLGEGHPGQPCPASSHLDLLDAQHLLDDGELPRLFRLPHPPLGLAAGLFGRVPLLEAALLSGAGVRRFGRQLAYSPGERGNSSRSGGGWDYVLRVGTCRRPYTCHPGPPLLRRGAHPGAPLTAGPEADCRGTVVPAESPPGPTPAPAERIMGVLGATQVIFPASISRRAVHRVP